MTAYGMIAPVLALVAWTFVMWAWMYATRIPAMQRAKIDVNELSRTGAKLELPAQVTRVADNYNHLHEQPTLFYAVALAALASGVNDPIAILIAWAYVGVRIVHSLLQATVNVIPLRFLLFVIASGALLALLVRVAQLTLV